MKQIQIRGGSTHDHMVGPHEKGFIGLPREITIDTNLWTIRVHDGLTIGGFLLAKLSEVYTKAEIDQKIIEIVSGGEINLDGYATKNDLNQKANLDHVHEQYSNIVHDHPDKASKEHQHGTTDVYFEDGETLLQKYNNNTLSNVDMTNYVTNEIFNSHKHEQYSPITHVHTEYSLTSHNHNNDYSNINHKHTNYLEIDVYNESIELFSRLGHIHKSDEITHNTQLLSEYLNNLSVKEHRHDYNDLDNLPFIPNKTSELINDKKFVTKEELEYIGENNHYHSNILSLNKISPIKLDFWDKKAEVDYVNSELIKKQAKLKPGTNITIDENNVIQGTIFVNVFNGFENTTKYVTMSDKRFKTRNAKYYTLGEVEK